MPISVTHVYTPALSIEQIDIELINSLHTNSIHVKKVFIGTNFVGGQTELKHGIKKIAVF